MIEHQRHGELEAGLVIAVGIRMVTIIIGKQLDKRTVLSNAVRRTTVNFIIFRHSENLDIQQTSSIFCILARRYGLHKISL